MGEEAARVACVKCQALVEYIGNRFRVRIQGQHSSRSSEARDLSVGCSPKGQAGLDVGQESLL